MGKLNDRVAVVTGGSSGIGLATARRFIADGVVCQKSAEQKLSHFQGFGACHDCRFRPITLDSLA